MNIVVKVPHVGPGTGGSSTPPRDHTWDREQGEQYTGLGTTRVTGDRGSSTPPRDDTCDRGQGGAGPRPRDLTSTHLDI